YQLTMLQSYVDGDMHGEAVFELFVRRLPEKRNFLIAAGLAQLVDYLERLRFTSEDVAALEKTGLFHDRFLGWLEELRFTGDVDAMPEGTIFFPNEPIVRVTAPLPQAQLVESRLINLLHFQTMIASKAARFVLAAGGAALIDFGMRRAHGAEAAMLAARASYLSGFAGSATVVAHPLFGIPVFGTMAHSYIEAHDSEVRAFERFALGHRGAIVLLIDTYDTEKGAERVVRLAEKLAPEGIEISSVRIDSGDIRELARRVRAILDRAPGTRIGILASGGIDEADVERLLRDGTPVDGFGIGTALDASTDAPSLDCAYKLQEYGGRARAKRSPGKATLPGRKQVYRRYDAGGRLSRDVVTVLGDEQPGEPLLTPVVRNGRTVGALPELDAIRARVRDGLERLPDALRSLSRGSDYPVDVAPALRALADEVGSRAE
ncbi:MAG: nicotinate phosphoribosyltransferase, partial [Gammaproteobacteria bacterium]|nr:nicotinate phosphoribosyltransferase [Gammaproteobacteria bacterium]